MSLLARHFAYHALRHALGRPALDRPLMGYLYLTYRCDLSCTYCNDGAGVKYPDKWIDSELTTAGWIRVLEVLRRDVDSLILTGGEPYCRRDLAEILRAARRLRYRFVCVLTNGLGLPGRLETLDSIDLLLIGLDSMDREESDRMMGRPGAHARVLEGIARARAARRERRVRIVLNVCVTPQSVRDAHAVVDFALESGVGVAVSPELRGLYPARRLRESAEYRALIDRLIRLKRRGLDVLGSMLYLQGIRTFAPFRCQPTLLARIRPDGALLYPCNKLNTTGGNLLAAGGYIAAVHAGAKRHGPVPHCDNRCHAGCYMDFSLLVQRPWWLIDYALGALARRRRASLSTRRKDAAESARTAAM